MIHQRQMGNQPRLGGELVRRLPDGRRLVTALNRPTKVIDSDGNEIVPSPSEIVVLELMSDMSFPALFWTEDSFST